MGENSNFSINSIEVPTKDDITVTFSPNEGTTTYTYNVYKDNVLQTTKQINSKDTIDIVLNQTGNYKIVAEMYDASNNVTTVQSGNYIIDKSAPVINTESYIEVSKGKNLNNNVTAYDNVDGDLSSNITSNINELDFNEIGHQKLVYSVTDSAGNYTSKTVDVNVVSGDYTLFIVQAFLIICLIILMAIAFKFKQLLRLEKRLENYSLSPKKGNNISLADIFLGEYQKLNKRIAKSLEKSVFANKYAKKLDKYAVVTENHKNGMEILALKIITSLALLFVAFVANVIQVKFLPVYEIGLPLLVGFFIPDILYFAKYKNYKRTIENDLLSAIIIMNNAFKAGRNITQAIEIVGNELNGVIAKEFKKMSLELSYGLDIEVIFKRFAKRVQIEEVNYLTASLTVLNKTGGNIVEVFSSIEKTMFNKKTLRLELASLTGSSRIIVYVLLAIPFFFVLVLTVINPSYFVPFVSTNLGMVLLGIMIIYYALFVFVVRKIMKVVI